ncbi:MAG TPA: beta-ketoacyl synthase N-terminal-like domain-containing protein [Opitutaceae bacterium]|nr:beta-ketoacyl synthase N-terminal-like domain-containing protein [Opitutaceae bacterium]
MDPTVFLLGAGRTDFKRNFRKEGKVLRDIIAETTRATLDDARVPASDVSAGVIGNFASGLYTRQLHLGSLLIDADPALKGIPTFHTEAACASGSVAVVAGIHQILSGLADVVLVVGAEQQKTMSPAEGADVLAAAGDWDREKPLFGEHMFPKLFAQIASHYLASNKLPPDTLADLVAKNYENAQRNPFAQKFGAPMTREQACSVTEKNPEFAPPLKISDCSQVTDGGAGIVLASRRYVERTGRTDAIRLAGFGHATDHLELSKKDSPHFTVARKAIKQAYDRAGLTPGDIHAAEVHDCFSISEIIQYELLGFAEEGHGWKLLADGATRFDGPIPVNVSGGLIADGHPVGATGVRQVWEACRQLTGTAGERQLQDVSRFLCFNMGGSMTTNVCTIWTR